MRALRLLPKFKMVVMICWSCKLSCSWFIPFCVFYILLCGKNTGPLLQNVPGSDLRIGMRICECIKTYTLKKVCTKAHTSTSIQCNTSSLKPLRGRKKQMSSIVHQYKWFIQGMFTNHFDFLLSFWVVGGVLRDILHAKSSYHWPYTWGRRDSYKYITLHI